jgi:NADPH-dependent curcumin reductase CurA
MSMTASPNRQVWLRERPNGIPQAEDFGIRSADIPKIEEGQFLIRNEFLSADPAMRGWIADKSNYWPRIEVGDTMRAFSAGTVVESMHGDYRVGDKVMGIFGWQDYAAVNQPQVMRKVRESDLPLSLSLGVLGLNGLTAYFGLLDVCQPRAGDTVVISTAAGAVGSAAGQIAKLKGAAIDYKAVGDLDEALSQACPRGIDAYFDNTSGLIHDAVMRLINVHARIAICGTASYASWSPWNDGPRPERHLLVKRATMRGFLTTDFAERYEEAIEHLAGWIRTGQLKYREKILNGIEAAPGSIAQLYSGQNSGKLIIKL